jgi:hypothetical protein
MLRIALARALLFIKVPQAITFGGAKTPIPPLFRIIPIESLAMGILGDAR